MFSCFRRLCIPLHSGANFTIFVYSSMETHQAIILKFIFIDLNKNYDISEPAEATEHWVCRLIHTLIQFFCAKSQSLIKKGAKYWVCSCTSAFAGPGQQFQVHLLFREYVSGFTEYLGYVPRIKSQHPQGEIKFNRIFIVIDVFT